MQTTLSQPIVFLDTSIQIQRTLALPEQASPIEAQLRLPTVKAVTSSYVWMEYQRTVIADYAYLQRLGSRWPLSKPPGLLRKGWTMFCNRRGKDERKSDHHY